MPCDPDTLRRIVNNPNLSPAQKARALSIEAEGALPYPMLDADTQAALDARVICDMYEGHAPYKPRYVLPDYSVALSRGSEWLELPAPQTLDEALYQKIKLFWRYVDRVLPDAFLHANIGPSDNRVARIILRVDGGLGQIAPNLTFRYDPAISSDAILAQAIGNITTCSKPHIANHPLHSFAFDARLWHCQLL